MEYSVVKDGCSLAYWGTLCYEARPLSWPTL